MMIRKLEFAQKIWHNQEVDILSGGVAQQMQTLF